MGKTVAWVKGRALGEGSYGKVSLATLNDKPIAVKSSLSGSSSSTLSLLNEERTLLQLRDCPYVVDCLGHDITYTPRSAIYNLFLEYLPGGDLSDYVKRCGGRLSEPEVRDIARSVLRGLSFIHANGYVHCDIKPQNVLLSEASPPDVKICDFGLAKKAGASCSDNGQIDEGLRGTPQYMSPEAVTCRSFEPPMDVWGLGCVVLSMFTGQHPWPKRPGRARKDRSVLVRIASPEEYPDVPSDLSDSCKDFLSRCFVRDAESRWTADMLLEHPFLQSSDPEIDAAAQAIIDPSHSIVGSCGWEEDDVILFESSSEDDDSVETLEKSDEDESVGFLSRIELTRKRRKITSFGRPACIAV